MLSRLLKEVEMCIRDRVSVTESYFTSIPPEERNGVKYLISDMYNQYIDYVDKYLSLIHISSGKKHTKICSG